MPQAESGVALGHLSGEGKISIQSCDPIKGQWNPLKRLLLDTFVGLLKELSFQNSALKGVHNTSMSFGP